MASRLNALCPELGKEPLLQSIADQIEATKIAVDSEKLETTLHCACPRPLSARQKGLVVGALKRRFPGRVVRLKTFYPYASLDMEGVEELLEELKAAGMPLNGYLSGAEIEIAGETITLGAKNGVTMLESMGFCDALAELVEKHTGLKPRVQLIATEALVEEEVIQRISKKKAAAAKPPARKVTLPPKLGLVLSEKPPEVMLGGFFSPKRWTPSTICTRTLASAPSWATCLRPTAGKPPSATSTPSPLPI